MKFANLNYMLPLIMDEEESRVNIGDYIISEGIFNIYDKMGIPRNEVTIINWDEIPTYDGDYVILPISGLLTPKGYSKDGHFWISPKIIPVFCGITFDYNKWKGVEGLFVNLKKYEPIGCRDDVVLKVLQDNGVSAYLSGCPTIALPHRNDDPNDGKVFFVDIPERLWKYIPQNYKEKGIVCNHSIYMRTEKAQNREYVWGMAKKRYEQYISEAKLIVTSRLHATIPAIAFGIPVILVRDSHGFTFSWVNKFVPVNLKKDYEKINWDPQPLDIEKHKENVIDVFSKQIMDTYNRYLPVITLSEYYENRSERIRSYEECQNVSLDAFYDDLALLWKDKNITYRYALWGVNKSTEKVFNYISETYPNAILESVYDRDYKLSFHGVESLHPRNIVADDLLVIVVPTSAVETAKRFFRKINKDKNSYLFVSDSSIEGVN